MKRISCAKARDIRFFVKAFVYLRILHDAVAGKILQPDDVIFAQEMHLVPGVVRVQVPGLVRHHLVDVQVEDILTWLVLLFSKKHYLAILG